MMEARCSNSRLLRALLSAVVLLTMLLMQTQAARHMYGMGLNAGGQLGVFNSYAPNSAMTDIAMCGSTSTFTIAVTTGNKMFGFGDNSEHQLGMLTPKSTAPTPIEITSSAFADVTFKHISVGAVHTLALSQDGRVFSFGLNIDGQLGIGKNVQPNGPVHLSDLDGMNIVNVFAFGYSSFAVNETGFLWAWGSNFHLQLGLPRLQYDEPYYLPNLVTSVSDVRTLFGGDSHVFIVLDDGTIFGMGDNSKGQLGLGFSSTDEAMTQIDPFIDLSVVSIVAGYRTTFALTATNELYVVGDNTFGLMGLNNTSSMVVTPTKVTSLGTDVAFVAVGQNHALVATKNGSVFGAGQNSFGQLGSFPTFTSKLSFTPISGLSNVSALFAGSSQSAALLENGTLLTWGNILYNGMGSILTTPTLSKFETPFAFIFAGADFALGMEDTVGNIWGWGDNEQTPLTNDGPMDRFAPIKIPTLDGVNITQIAIGGDGNNQYHIISVANNKTFFVWGNNDKNQLGLKINGKIVSPTVNPGIQNKTFSMLGAGESHSISLTPEFVLSGWGNNFYGQLGLGSDYDVKINPVAISGSTVVSAAAGFRHTIFATSTGEVYAMGSNAYGQLGLPLNASQPNFFSAQRVPLDANATAVFAGGRCSFIVTEDGDLYAMGDNSKGTLGIGRTNTTIIDTPTLVDITIEKPGIRYGNKAPLKVASSKFDTPGHTLVLSTGGEVWVFGDNTNGQLGNSNFTDPIFTPVKLTIPEDVLDVAVGKDFSLILTGDRPCLASCSNHGYCDGILGACRCHTGYFGDRCEYITCEDKNNCNEPNGVCDYTTGFCNCTEKYSGNSCESRKCPNNCSNNGQCDKTNGNCHCNDGWTGDDCNTEVSGAQPQRAMVSSVVFSVIAVVVSVVLFMAVPLL